MRKNEKGARVLAQQDRLLIDNGISPKQAAIDKREAEKAKGERKLAENTFNKVARSWLHEQIQVNWWKNDYGEQRAGNWCNLIRAAVHFVKTILNEASVCGMRDRLDEFFAKSAENNLKRRRQMTDKENPIGIVAIEPKVGKVNLEFASIGGRGQSYRTTLSVASALQVGTGLIKAAALAESAEKSRNDAVKNIMKSALKDIAEEDEKNDFEGDKPENQAKKEDGHKPEET